MPTEKRSTMITTGTVAKNKKARFNYEIVETMEAGLVLTGAEVKSLRQGRASINEAYAEPENGGLYLLNASIQEYGAIGYVKHEANRPRLMLLRKREIKRLTGSVQRKGFTLVPLSLYFNARGLAKVELALATGKNTVDKRQTIKQREWDREKRRVLKTGGRDR